MWVARLIAERRDIHLPEIQRVAPGFRESVYRERCVEARAPRVDPSTGLCETAALGD